MVLCQICLMSTLELFTQINIALPGWPDTWPIRMARTGARTRWVYQVGKVSRMVVTVWGSSPPGGRRTLYFWLEVWVGIVVIVAVTCVCEVSCCYNSSFCSPLRDYHKWADCGPVTALRPSLVSASRSWRDKAEPRRPPDTSLWT